MTDPDAKEPTPPAEEPASGIGEKVGEAVERVEQTVEHAVEEVAEGVAEHVPEPIREPVRWTVRKLVLVIVLSAFATLLVIAFGVAYYVWNHTEWASHEVAWRVNQVLRTHSDVELTVDGLRGNPLSRVEVIHPMVRFRDGGPPLLEARTMTLRYSTWNLFAGKRGTLLLEVHDPKVRLVRGPDGKLHLPEWRPGAGPRKIGRGWDYQVRITGGDFSFPEDEHGIEGLDLDALVATGGATSVEIRSLSWKKGPYDTPLTKMVASIHAADSVSIQVRQLESSPLRLHGDARWKRGERHIVVQGEVAKVEWRWMAKVFRNRTFDVPGQAAFSVRAERDFGWTGEAVTRATWDDLPLEGEAQFAFRDDKLSMPHLAGRSPAGDLIDGRLSWSKAGWELVGRARDADPARWDALGLVDWPEGDLQGRFRYAVDTRGPPRSALEATLGPSTIAGWRADSSVVRAFFPPGAPDTFRVDAQRRGGRLALSGRTDAEGWTGTYRIADFPLDEWPDGRATGLTGTLSTGEGTIQSRKAGLFVTGELQGRATRWLGMDAAAWRLADVRGRLLPTPELEARAWLQDAFYLGLHFDSVATPMNLGDRTLALPALVATAGDTVVTMAAGANWDQGSWRFTGDQAVLRSSRFDWRASEPLRISGNAQGVTFERLVAADGPAQVEIEGRWAIPGGSYDWQARARALDLSRLGLPDSLGLTGTSDVDLRVTGPSGNPRWTFTSATARPTLQGMRSDSLRLDLEGAPSTLVVNRMDLRVGQGWIEAQGRFDRTAGAWPDSLSPEGVSRWLAGAERWSGKVTARDVPMDAAVAQLRLPAGLTGTLNGTLAVAGRPGRPTFDADLRAAPMAWRNLRLDEIVARAHYDGERLRVERLRGTREAAVSDVSGEITIDLALGRQPQVLDAPMSWTVELPNGDLSLLSLLVPQVGAATGRFEVHGTVRGTPRRPVLEGTARISDGKVRFATRSEQLEDVSARFTFASDRITLDSLSAVQHTRQRESGRVWARGTVQLPAQSHPTYRFEVSLRDFTASEQGAYAARFDGDFVVVDGRLVDGQRLPHITSDNVEVERAVILYDFTRQSEAEQIQASTQKLPWTYRIRVHATDNLRWQPADGDIEFSADLSLDQSPERLVIFGDMEALRGTYYFLSNRFNVERAVLTFDEVRGVDPIVDAEATTRLVPTFIPAASGGSAGTDRPYIITVRITGRASRPEVAFDSEGTEPGAAPMDQAQILRELTVGRFVAGEKVSLADPLDSYLTRAISRQLSGELSRAFRGYLTDWEIARESGGARNLYLGVGTYINSRLGLRYRQALPGTERYAGGTTTTTMSLIERDIEAEYRLNRFFYITSQLTQKRTAATSVSGTPDFNVNLKARWEY